MRPRKPKILLDPESREYYILEAAIKDVVWGPFDLGQVMAQAFTAMNKNQHDKMSVMAFTSMLARTFPFRGERWYRRLYHVYNRIVMQAKVKRDQLQHIDLKVLYTAAESVYLDPSTLRKTILHIAKHHHRNSRGAKRYLWTVINKQRSSVKGLAKMILKFDAMFVEDLLQIEEA